MKIDKLMIGDLINVNGIVRVREISEGTGRCCYEDKYGSYWAREVAPIPLTIEMLLANGFTKFVDGYRRTFYNYVVDNNLMLDISDWEDEGLKVAVGGKFRELKYVHELQHILRLIGLGEVANNFKIK